MGIAARWASKTSLAIQALGIDERSSKMMIDHMPSSVAEARAVVLGSLIGVEDDAIVSALLLLCDI